MMNVWTRFVCVTVDAAPKHNTHTHTQHTTHTHTHTQQRVWVWGLGFRVYAGTTNVWGHFGRKAAALPKKK